MEYVSLKNLFDQSKDILRSKLEGKKIPSDFSEIQSIVKDTFVELLTKDNEFSRQLHYADAQLLKSIIRLYGYFSKVQMNESIDYKKFSSHTQERVISKENDSKSTITEDLIYYIPTVAVAFISPWLTIPVALGSAYTKKYMQNSKKPEITTTKETVNISKLLSKENIDEIIDALEKFCDEIDKIINDVRHNREEIKNQYEKRLQEYTFDKMFPNLLNTLRYVWKENKEKSSENSSIDTLFSDLENYGYKIVEYSEENRKYFSFQSNPKVNKEEMYLPAIIKDDGAKVIEGKVFIPKSQNIEENERDK